MIYVPWIWLIRLKGAWGIVLFSIENESFGFPAYSPHTEMVLQIFENMDDGLGGY